MELEQMMRDIGLTQYEASAYHCLSAHGVLSASDISRYGTIPMGKIYETLRMLEDKGFLEVQPSRPKKYRAVAPSVAFGKYYAHIAMEKDRELLALRETMDTIERSLPLRQGTEEDDEVFWTTTFGTKEMEAAYVSYFMEAREEICIVTSSAMGEEEHKYYQALLKPMVRLIVAAAKTGTRIRCLDSFTGIRDVLSSVLVTIPSEKERGELSRLIEVREHGTPYDFVITDDDVCVLDIPDPITPGTVMGTFRIRDRKFNTRLRGEFDRLWEAAGRHSLTE